MEKHDGDGKQIQTDINEFSIRLNEDLRNRKVEQERLAFALSRISPASAYQLAATNLAGTDIALKARYEDAMRTNRIAFTECVEMKQKETGGTGGFRITFDCNTGLKFSAPRDSGSLDLSNMPQFKVPDQSIADVAGAVATDGGDFGLSITVCVCRSVCGVLAA